MRLFTVGAASLFAAFIVMPPSVSFACDVGWTCRLLTSCLVSGVENDKQRIREGARTGGDQGGHLVWEGGDACYNNWGAHNTWAGATAGCRNDPEFVQAGRCAVRNVSARHR
jgi:hypothetical protein